MSQRPSVLISIPCYNEKQYIAACLDSILAQNYPSNLINVFVVDGMSEDGTRAILSEYASKHEQINFLDNPKKVTPVALNIGLKAMDCDAKIILGAHSKIDKDFVSNSVEILEEKKDVGCVGGIIENIFENKTAEIIGYAMSSSFGVGNAHFRTGNAEGYVDTVAFGAYRKKVFEKIGYFDEDLVRNQDDEFNFRLTEAGFKVFLSKSIRSQYHVRASYQKLRRQYFQYGYWKVFVNKKYNTVTSIRQLVPPLFVSGIVSLVLLGLVHSLFWQLLLAVLFAYLIGAFVFANKSGAPVHKRGAVMLVFGILHFSYGWGYIIGIIDFLLLNKKPKSSSKEISR